LWVLSTPWHPCMCASVTTWTLRLKCGASITRDYCRENRQQVCFVSNTKIVNPTTIAGIRITQWIAMWMMSDTRSNEKRDVGVDQRGRCELNVDVKIIKNWPTTVVLIRSYTLLLWKQYSLYFWCVSATRPIRYVRILVCVCFTTGLGSVECL